MRCIGLASLLLCAYLPQAGAQSLSLERFSIDGGGEVLAETADQQWQLSGTLGQWDSTDPLGLSGSGFTLIGGFWPQTRERNRELFSDGFEASPP